MSPIDMIYPGKPILPIRLFRYCQLFWRFRLFTMVSWRAYLSNLYLTDRFLGNAALADGCIIECGTWKGGMAAGLACIGGPNRHYYFFDSFKGLPLVTIEDGDDAREWQQNRSGPRYFNNCTAGREEFANVIALANLPLSHVHVYEGFFKDSFSEICVPPIAILRLDADWYDSTLLCLETFWDRLIPGALIIIDDYFDWEGCRKAVHHFLAKRKAREAISQLCFGHVTYITKL